jgi:chemotaxis protein CheD
MSEDDKTNPDQPVPPREERRASATAADTYFNSQFDAKALYLQPGQVLCGDDGGVMYVAKVGSGVLATMHDTELKIGAMCYVLIPPQMLETFPHFEKADPEWRQAALGPLEECVAEMKKRGAGKHRIQIRLIGGGTLPGQGTIDAGTKNYIFVREYITRKGLHILNEDLGGSYVRRVHFFPATGRAVRLMLRRASDFDAIRDAESKNQSAK